MQALRYSQKVACNGRSAQTQHLKASCIFNQLCLHITYTIIIHLLVPYSSAGACTLDQKADKCFSLQDGMFCLGI